MGLEVGNCLTHTDINSGRSCQMPREKTSRVELLGYYRWVQK